MQCRSPLATISIAAALQRRRFFGEFRHHFLLHGKFDEFVCKLPTKLIDPMTEKRKKLADERDRTNSCFEAGDYAGAIS
jgi:hypothetical protein